MGNRQSRKNKNDKKNSQSKSLKSATTVSTQKQPPTTSTKTSSNIRIGMTNNPKQRLLVVTFGFIRRSVDMNRFNQIPIVIIELCSKWVFQVGSNDICIKFFKYYYYPTSIPMAIELSIDDKNDCDTDIYFFDKIFDNTLIKKYQINYIKIEKNERNQVDNDQNDCNTKEFIEKKIDCGLLNSVIAPVNCINDSKCYAFTFPNAVDRGSEGDMLVQVNAMDERDGIVLSSKWRVMNAGVVTVSYVFEEYNDDAIEKYWNQRIIEKKNSNCCGININEWINAMKRLRIIQDENDARLIFWFILFNNKSSLNEMKVEDLKKFVFDDSFEEYSQKFSYPIGRFQRTIPNFFL